MTEACCENLALSQIRREHEKAFSRHRTKVTMQAQSIYMLFIGQYAKVAEIK